MALRRVAVAIGLCSVWLVTDGSDPAAHPSVRASQALLASALPLSDESAPSETDGFSPSGRIAVAWFSGRVENLLNRKALERCPGVEPGYASHCALYAAPHERAMRPQYPLDSP